MTLERASEIVSVLRQNDKLIRQSGGESLMALDMFEFFADYFGIGDDEHKMEMYAEMSGYCVATNVRRA